ncbi:MAG: DNA replication and repair protein RecF [Verrucomicrobiae bacterium]|nr:DNA replication and repair protein RecF [Verrucomicrobiae bacterium]
MLIQELRLSQFRCHHQFSARFSSHLNLIVGNNGRGKTALLEAIYYVSRLRSFRTATTRELIEHSKKQFAIRLFTETDKLAIDWSPEEKKIFLNDNPVKPIDFLHHFICVALTSQDKELCGGGSSERRKFISSILIQLDQQNLIFFLNYQKVLKHRNALLRQINFDKILFESLTHQLEKLGKPLQQAHQQLARRIGKIATIFYKHLSKNSETLDWQYTPTSWNVSFEEEKQYKRTLIGFHRDQIVLRLNQKPMAAYGSEGQHRTAAVALKLAEIYLLRHRFKKNPIILVDDIFGELDDDRCTALLNLLHPDFQIFITSTNLDWLKSKLKNFQKLEL